MIKLQKKLILITIYTIIISSLFIPVSFATDKANSVQALQSKLNAAMQARKTSYSIIYSGKLSTFSKDVTDIFNNVFNADDYLRYVTKRYKCTCVKTNGVTTVTFALEYLENASQTTFIKNRVSQILKQIITPDMNDFQKEKAIHDWIVNNVSYDTTLTQFSAYAGLVSPYKTVCNGYSLLAYKMLNSAGIKTKIIEGKGNNQSHNWNLVYLDGAWYHLDVVWDDPVPDVPGKVSYNYYNLTDSQIKVNHTWTKTYPAAETDFYNTITTKIANNPLTSSIYQGIYDDLGLNLLTTENSASSQQELSSLIQQSIQNQEDIIKVRYTNIISIADDLCTAFYAQNNVISYSYISEDLIRTADTGDAILTLKINYIP